MKVEFFNAGMTELSNLYDDERLIQVHTTNSINDDGLYFTAMTDEIEDEDFEGEIRYALGRRYGRGGGDMYVGWEDVTDLYYDENGDVL